jgi:hypothetical protein
MHLRYTFSLTDGSERRFEVILDPRTLELRSARSGDAAPRPAGTVDDARDASSAFAAPPPEWTALENEQCLNCPLRREDSPHCPVALAVDPVIAAFHDSISHHQALITIETPARTYQKHATLQAGISGVIGLLMSTAGCPILDKLRPMVRTHLPFATLPETMFRAMGMYLLAQYFISQRGGTPNWDLKGLGEVYAEVRKVNKAFLKRLRTLKIEDASLNAIVNLDVFATFTTMTLDAANLEEVEDLFGAYLR